MRKSFTALLGLAIAGGAAMPAFAQDTAAPAASPSDFTINGTATLVTDYRFRGVSQSNNRFAIQGGLTVSHATGFYASVWGSSIDDYIANGGNTELDLIGGWKHTFMGTTLDVGALYYYYPGSHGANTDFIEPYASLSHTLGPVTGKVTVNYAPKQKAIGIVTPSGFKKEDNVYLAGDLSAAIPKTPLSVTAHLGHTFGPSYLVPVGNEYTDWGVGVSYAYKNLSIGVNYVDTDKNCYLNPAHPANQCRATAVGSIGVSF